MRPGRLIRRQMELDALETPETVAERIRYREIAEQAVREREERWPVLTPENMAEAVRWQTERIRELQEQG